MISHTHLGTTNLENAIAFYDDVLAPLGLTRKLVDDQRGWAVWKHSDFDRPLFIVGLPENSEPHVSGNGQMIALLASDRVSVQACYDAALKVGATSAGAPGLRPQYHEHYFGAYFYDLDGNKIAICCHEPI